MKIVLKILQIERQKVRQDRSTLEQPVQSDRKAKRQKDGKTDRQKGRKAK
jgi:hypothetical protein